MAVSLEDRIRSLEETRLRNIARINACQSLAVGAWAHISLQERDPVAFAKKVTKAWKSGVEKPGPAPRGLGPAYLDALSSEYEQAIADLSKQLLGFVQQEATRLGLPRKT